MDTNCLRDFRDDSRGVADRRQIDEPGTVRKDAFDALRNLDSEPGLADASRTGQGNQLDIIAAKEVADFGQFAIAPDQSGQWSRERSGWRRGSGCGHACPSVLKRNVLGS